MSKRCSYDRATIAKHTRGSGSTREDHHPSNPAAQLSNTQRTRGRKASVIDTEEVEPDEPRNVRQRKERTDAERRDTGGGGATGPPPRFEK